MLSSRYELPNAILNSEQGQSAWLLMAEAEAALERLHLQMGVLEVVRLFESAPDLLAFTFDLDTWTDDDGRVSHVAHARVDARHDHLAFALADRVGDVIGLAFPQNLLTRLQGQRFERPDDESQLAESLMRACLPEADFALWQAAALEAHAAPAAPRATRSL